MGIGFFASLSLPRLLPFKSPYGFTLNLPLTANVSLPGNLSAFFCGDAEVTLFSAEIHKSALGAEDSVTWEHVDDTMDAVRRLKEEGYTIVCAEQTVGSVMLDKFVPEPGKRYAVVFGNEVSGVRQDVVDAADFCLEIPQFGTKHSLNVSVSVGVILWHFRLHI